MNKVKTWFINFSIIFFSLLVVFGIIEDPAKLYIEHSASESGIKKYASLKLINPIVFKEIAAEENVPLFNFAEIFPQNRRYCKDDIHVNERGSRLKSKLFSEFILLTK